MQVCGDVRGGDGVIQLGVVCEVCYGCGVMFLLLYSWLMRSWPLGSLTVRDYSLLSLACCLRTQWINLRRSLEC